MKIKLKNKELLEQIQNLKLEHPFWGYRRVWAYLKYRKGLVVNKKRIYWLMKENNFLIVPNTKLKALRAKYLNRSKPKAIRPNQFWGIDMTKLLLKSFGWLYLVIVLDWFTKKIIGYSLKMHSKTQDWLEALNNAVNNQFPQWILSKSQELFLISDNGSQPTSEKFMQACSVLEIKQIFTCYDNPKGNAGTERVIRTLKEDLIWLRQEQWETPFDVEEDLKVWIERYNTDYPHSSLGYKTSVQYEKEQLLLTTKI
ncbi:MAG: IS3 family transposase [Candidatus Omnitrophica bacterium]|nr:IS3 family transposase [Candidatus Omnitrophota bacterium]